MCLYYIVGGQLDADAWGGVCNSKFKIEFTSRICCVFNLLSTVCRLHPAGTGTILGWRKQMLFGCTQLARIALRLRTNECSRLFTSCQFYRADCLRSALGSLHMFILHPPTSSITPTARLTLYRKIAGRCCCCCRMRIHVFSASSSSTMYTHVQTERFNHVCWYTCMYVSRYVCVFLYLKYIFLKRQKHGIYISFLLLSVFSFSTSRCVFSYS